MTPYSVGGASGAVNECYIHRVDGTETAVTKAPEIAIAAGDKVRFLTAGGGGYGNPLERNRGDIENDIRNCYLSEAAASAAYGRAFKTG